MNSMKNFDAFLGSFPERNISPIPIELVQQVCEVKKTLGAKRYLLDKYFRFLLEGFALLPAWTIAEDGFNLYGRLWGLCSAVLDGRIVDDPFYGRAAAFIQDNPIQYEPSLTKSQVYTLKLAGEFIRETGSEALQSYREKIDCHLDIIQPGSLYGEMAQIFGQVPVDSLNELICSSYIPLNAADLLLQGFFSHMFYTFTHRDDESGQEIFLLLLETQIPTE